MKVKIPKIWILRKSPTPVKLSALIVTIHVRLKRAKVTKCIDIFDPNMVAELHWLTGRQKSKGFILINVKRVRFGLPDQFDLIGINVPNIESFMRNIFWRTMKERDPPARTPFKSMGRSVNPWWRWCQWRRGRRWRYKSWKSLNITADKGTENCEVSVLPWSGRFWRHQWRHVSSCKECPRTGQVDRIPPDEDSWRPWIPMWQMQNILDR